MDAAQRLELLCDGEYACVSATLRPHLACGVRLRRLLAALISDGQGYRCRLLLATSRRPRLGPFEGVEQATILQGDRQIAACPLQDAAHHVGRPA